MVTVWMGPSSVSRPGSTHLFGRDEATVRSPEKELVEERVGAEHLPVAVGVGSVHVHEGGVEPQRRHSDQLLTVLVGRGHRAQSGVHA